MKKKELVIRMQNVMDEIESITKDMPKGEGRMFALVGFDVDYKKNKNRIILAQEGMKPEQVGGIMLRAFKDLPLGQRASIIELMIEFTQEDMDVEKEKQRRENDAEKSQRATGGITKRGSDDATTAERSA